MPLDEINIEQFLEDVERQLSHDALLLQTMTELNEQIKAALNDANIRDAAAGVIHAVGLTTETIERRAEEISAKRSVLLDRINQHSDQEFGTVGQFLEQLPLLRAKQLHQRQKELLQRVTEAHAELGGYQIALYYSVDYCQRYLSDLTQTSEQSVRYTMDGQPPEQAQGQLIRKSC
ncbi:MAG: hypothetical protein VXZ82_20885 [Planctomycetota bacterium]|nr:hypothetical protein [Planctomycetota bacterium]